VCIVCACTSRTTLLAAAPISWPWLVDAIAFVARDDLIDDGDRRRAWLFGNAILSSGTMFACAPWIRPRHPTKRACLWPWTDIHLQTPCYLRCGALCSAPACVVDGSNVGSSSASGRVNVGDRHDILWRRLPDAAFVSPAGNSRASRPPEWRLIRSRQRSFLSAG
jgi:hypothetical protein